MSAAIPPYGGGAPGECGERLRQIRLLVLDVDGVLTDGRIVHGDDGFEYKAFHTHDGYGLTLLRAAGIERAVVTARSSALVARRMEELAVQPVLQGRRDKAAALGEIAAHFGLASEAVAYIGDDDLDVPALLQAGLAITVADASPWACAHAHWVTRSPGGAGAVREAAEGILHAQGWLDTLRARGLS